MFASSETRTAYTAPVVLSRPASESVYKLTTSNELQVVGVEDSISESDGMVSLLKRRILNKTTRHAALTREMHHSTAQEEILKKQIHLS